MEGTATASGRDPEGPRGVQPGAGPVTGGTGRIGRNLPAAVAVGVALGAVVLASLYVVKAAFLIVVLGFAGLGIHELARAVAARDIRVPEVPLLAGMTVSTTPFLNRSSPPERDSSGGSESSLECSR